MAPKRKLRVAVLMGGVSNEREVSFKSGKAVTAALREAGHEALPVEVTERNVDQLDRLNPDVAFIALHGEFGEDGKVQAILEEKGIPYTGSGPEASRMGMDKVASKRAFVRHAVPTADYLVVDKGCDAARTAAQASHLGFPLFCKPSCGGSSIGISIVRSEADLPQAIQQAFDSVPDGQESQVLLEQYIRGREFTVGVVDGEPLHIIEIRSSRPFFDYEAKYKDEATEYIIPVSLIQSLYRKVQDAARQAYHALGCRHMARTDIIHGYDGGVYVLEVNTIPGFTARSLLPMAARYGGIEFADLCDRIAGMALRDADAARRALGRATA